MFPYTGEFRKKITGNGLSHHRYEQFIPRSLMDGGFFKMDDELSGLLISAHSALGILEGTIKYMPNREALKELMILKECYYSRSIDYKEPMLSEVLTSMNTEKSDYQHIDNIVSAYKSALGLQIGSKTLSEICTTALYGTEPEEKIYLYDTTIQTNQRYKPTPSNEILPTLRDMAMFIEKMTDVDILIKAALAHYQIEAIHPFEYYNGVVGRIMISMILHNEGYASTSYLCLSQYLYYHTNDYFSLLDRTQYSGGYHVWIKFFVQGICDAVQYALEQIEAMQQIIAEDEAKIESLKASTKATWTMYNYFKQNLLSEISVASKTSSLSYNTASKSVKVLFDIGILTQANNQLRHKVFEYTNLLKEFLKHYNNVGKDVKR